MEINAKSTDRNLLLEIQGELDHHGAKNALRELELAIDAALPTKLVLDLAGVTFMDSSGIGVIIGRYKKISYVGGDVYVCGIGRNVDRIFQMSGLYKLVKQLNEAEVV